MTRNLQTALRDVLGVLRALGWLAALLGVVPALLLVVGAWWACRAIGRKYGDTYPDSALARTRLMISVVAVAAGAAMLAWIVTAGALGVQRSSGLLVVFTIGGITAIWLAGLNGLLQGATGQRGADVVRRLAIGLHLTSDREIEAVKQALPSRPRRRTQ